MRVALLFALAISSVSSLEINGWYPCAPTTKPRAGDAADSIPEAHFNVKDKVAFECAQVPMPLCHDGICKSEEGEKVNVFVKRIVATAGGGNPVQQNAKPAKSMWFLQGGPGSPSVGMESLMYAAYKEHNATVSVYTLDHRGTGRSHFLDCEAAQVNTDGSPDSTKITNDEMASCLQDLNFRYKNKAAAFSITSAAMDAKKIIEGLQPNEDVYVSGYSYGTTLLQRLLQLKPAPVRGFIFEGVGVMTTEKDKFKSEWSRWDEHTLASSRRLFEACADDANCPLKFQNKSTVIEEVLAIYKKLDDEIDTNLCSKYLVGLPLYKKPSASLRGYISYLATDVNKRDYLPLILAKMKSCSQQDLDLIGPFIDPFYGLDDGTSATSSSTNATSSTASVMARLSNRRRLETRATATTPKIFDTLRSNNPLLYELVVFSELYAPLPSLAEIKQIYEANPLSIPDEFTVEYFDDIIDLIRGSSLPSEYCRNTGSQEETCKAISESVPKGPAFAYKRDKYWDVPLKLADKASVLVLNGGLDFQTPVEHGDALMSKLVGGRGKKSVTFDYGGHCRGEATATSMKMPCRNSIVKQFVANDGDVTKIDTSCLKDQPKPVFPTTTTAESISTTSDTSSIGLRV